MEWRTSSLQLEFRVFIKYETAELYRRPDIPYGHQLISDHLVPCMVSTEHENALSVLTLLPPQVSMCHNFNKTARQDIPISTWQDIPLSACHYIPISAWQYIPIFQHDMFTLSGRLSVPPISSPVQLESVGLCIQLSGIIMTLIIIIIIIFSDS